MSRILIISALLLVAASDATVLLGAPPAGREKQVCASPSYRQFDFWIGDWDVFDVDNPAIKVARVRVEPILNGCVLREDYAGADGHEGQSFSIFDASRQLWHQTWVTNNGQMLVIEGGMHGAEMVLSGVDHTDNGKLRSVRGVWKPVSGGVRESATRSTDNGATWSPWFDLLFRPHQP
jgi:hypothetical protein